MNRILPILCVFISLPLAAWAGWEWEDKLWPDDWEWRHKSGAPESPPTWHQEAIEQWEERQRQKEEELYQKLRTPSLPEPEKPSVPVQGRPRKDPETGRWLWYSE